MLKSLCREVAEKLQRSRTAYAKSLITLLQRSSAEKLYKYNRSAFGERRFIIGPTSPLGGRL